MLVLGDGARARSGLMRERDSEQAGAARGSGGGAYNLDRLIQDEIHELVKATQQPSDCAIPIEFDGQSLVHVPATGEEIYDASRVSRSYGVQRGALHRGSLHALVTQMSMEHASVVVGGCCVFAWCAGGDVAPHFLRSGPEELGMAAQRYAIMRAESHLERAPLRGRARGRAKSRKKNQGGQRGEPERNGVGGGRPAGGRVRVFKEEKTCRWSRAWLRGSSRPRPRRSRL
jgi:hypothetical protein